MRRRAAAAALLVPLAVGGGAGGAAAKTYTVTDGSDRGRGTLRAAVERANEHRGGDRIVLARSLKRNIRVKRDIAVRDSLKIIGRGAKGPALVGRRERLGYTAVYFSSRRRRDRLVLERIDARNLSVGAREPLIVRGSRFTSDGSKLAVGIFTDGGRISNSEISGWNTGVYSYIGDDLSIAGSVITGNGTGVDVKATTLDIKRSTVNHNGLGLDVFWGAYAEVRASRISGNTPNGGVSIGYESGALIERSTVAGNEAQRGGGVFVGDYSGVTVRNSTVSGNRATARGGGIYQVNSHRLTVESSTITGNAAEEGGAVFLATASAGDGYSIASSILAENRSESGAECASLAPGPPPVPVSEGGNVFGPDGCGATAPTDILTGDPGLGPLADNGGPNRTHALLGDSPAIGHGLDLGLKTDQRGEPRDADPDSGSFERQ